MQPETRFGRPSVNGISTEVVWEHEQAGEIPEEIAAEFGLSDEDVRLSRPGARYPDCSWPVSPGR
jgi:uncharacterized protein (DUF433 family)